MSTMSSARLPFLTQKLAILSTTREVSRTRPAVLPCLLPSLLLLLLLAAEPGRAQAQSWSPTGSMTSLRNVHQATLLNTGEVLAAAGQDNIGDTDSAELYDPVSGTWGATPPINYVGGGGFTAT